MERPSARPAATSLTRSEAALAGLAGGLLATAGMLVFGLATRQPTIAELLADAIVRLTPLAVIVPLTEALGARGKHLLFAVVLLGQLATGAGVAALVATRRHPLRSSAIVLVLLLSLVALIDFAIAGREASGAANAAGPWAVGAAMILMVTLYAGGYAVTAAALGRTRAAPPMRAARRELLGRSALLAGGLVLGGGVLRWLGPRLTLPGQAAPQDATVGPRLAGDAASPAALAQALQLGVPGMPAEITPNDSFYVVSKNVFRDPAVDGPSWHLTVDGLVDHSMELSYSDLLALPSTRQYFTLQCISNEIGGDLIGNAAWTGVPLGELLRRAGVRDTVVQVVLHGADDYVDGIPLSKAMEPGTILAFEMNGAPLPQAHGFPTRLLAPDTYGMKNVKWVTRIELVDEVLLGYWQVRGWNDDEPMHTTSRIDVPHNGTTLRPGPQYVGGIAVAGSRGIAGVEVSTDGGRTWQPAVLKAPLGPYTWVQWLYAWEAAVDPDSPFAKLLVRATDGTGVVQPPTVHEPLPNGASGWDAILVRVDQPSA